jgi:hypothetical protein
MCEARHRRRPHHAGRPVIDHSPEGLAAMRARIAEPAPILSAAQLREHGLDAGALADARRWRKVRELDHVLGRLLQLELIDMYWDRERPLSDYRISLLVGHDFGRRVIASACAPAARLDLDEQWDELRQLDTRAFYLDDLIVAYDADAYES